MRLLLLVAILLCLFSATAQATSSEQPAWVDQEATALAPSCGGLRAEVIARMDYARHIHVEYLAMVKFNPSMGKVAGDARWQSYWADTYVQTIKLLKQGCVAHNLAHP